MFALFESLASDSRIWIFQANRPFTADELMIVNQRLREFTDGWVAHGSPLKTSYTIPFDHFIVLAADEAHQSASGCSIDSSVRVLKSLEQSFGMDLFDRNRVAFRIAGRIVLLPLRELKQKFQEGILNEDTLTFNNLVSTKSEFEHRWIIPAGETWLRRYLIDPLVKVK